MFLRQTIAALVVMLLAALPARALELIIVEQPGCYACKQWNAEIAPIYPPTEVGQFAPLRREQLNAPPDDVTYSRPVNFTPTFLLIRDGAELARLEGYPGQDFFWWQIERMITEFAGFEGATR